MAARTKAAKKDRSETEKDRGGGSPSRAMGAVQQTNGHGGIQQAAGNLAVQRLLEARVIQPKLRASQPDDPSEKEADRVADAVIRSTVETDGPASSAPARTGSTEHDGHPVDSTTARQIESLKRGGRPLPESVRSFFEPRFGQDFSDVRIHTGPSADEAAHTINAQAFTLRNDIHFANGNYPPHSPGGIRLLAHELTHVIQQGRRSAAGRADETIPTVQRQARGTEATARNRRQPAESEAPSASAREVQWQSVFLGESAGTPVAIIYFPTDSFEIDENDERVLRRVSQTVSTKLLGGDVTVELDGYADKRGDSSYNDRLSKARVDAVRMFLDVFLDPARSQASSSISVDPTAHGINDAPQDGSTAAELSRFRRVEIGLKPARPTPSPPEQKRAQHTTLKEFIEFVETVERTYPAAPPREVASELRQLWYYGIDWRAMVASEGIRAPDGSAVNLALTSGTVGKKTDVTRWEPNEELVIDTPRGRVNMGHVLAGIDATLSGFPKEAPLSWWPPEAIKGKVAHHVIGEESGGDTRDFATWSGDLGQAYAEYLEQRWYHGESDASLDRFRREKAPDDQLRGDVHGYLATRLTGGGASSGGGSSRSVSSVSDILRGVYLPPPSTSRGGMSRSLRAEFERAAGNPGSLRAYVRERTLGFAAGWFYKNVGSGTTYDFAETHERNEAEAASANKVKMLVDYFLEFLDRQPR